MKKLIFSLALLVLGAYSLAAANNPSDTTLNNIQKKIYTSFTDATQQKNLNGLLNLQKRLEQAVDESVHFSTYWLAYSYYYHSIYYLQQKDEKIAESTIKKGISLLENKHNKNSEELTLLAMLQSFSIQFVNAMAAGVVAGKAKKNAESALEMDPQNLRAHFVAGQLDYYTPSMFGGGKKAEAYFKKAISLPDQKVKNPYLPSWGKSTAYTFLIDLLIEKKDNEQARKYLEEATALYPKDHQLAARAKELK
jgi:tetratricopeptide (TPR) repeat protein